MLKQIGVEGPGYAFELNLNALPQMKAKATKTKTVLEKADLTPIRRDFAFVISEDTGANEIVKAAKGADKAFITDVSVFDVYQGKGIDEGHKSIAIEVTLQPRATLLKDEDIAAISDKIIKAVTKATGATLRG